MEELISLLKSYYVDYRSLTEEMEDMENASFEDTEYYGVYLGKMELCETLLDKFGPPDWRDSLPLK